MRIKDIVMKMQAAIEGKRKWQKKWRAHMARVKALPQDYQIVYREIQKYLFKAGPGELTDGTDVLSGIVDLFEEGAALGKGVLEVTGSDVAAFCDDLFKDSCAEVNIMQESAEQELNRTMKKATDKTK